METLHKPKKKTLLLILLAGVLFYLALPKIISISDRIKYGNNPANFYFVSPVASQPLIQGQVFNVDLHVQTGSKAINAVSAVIKYNPELIEIIGMDTTQSFCSFYTENSFATIKGEVDIACGTPHPGFLGDSTITSLSLRSKVNGPISLTLSPQDSAILADDGKGTNLMNPKTLPELNLVINVPF